MQTANLSYSSKKRFYRKKWFKILLIALALVAVVGISLAWKAGIAINKISLKGGILKSLVHSLPGIESRLKGEEDGRINVLLLGMRGENIPGGSLLTDTIMVLSLKPTENKAALVSIPRDLYVDNPSWQRKTKINAVYAAGEENGKKQGISEMEKVVGDISGLPIHYGISINFKGFIDLIDALGGIDVNLDKPFEESLQFNEMRVCDNNVFTVPTGKFEHKKHTKKSGTVKIVASYPLCYPDPKYVECGGNFKLPAGNNNLDGKKALCYVRSRYSTSDFDRAKRQQKVLQIIRDKALRIGTLTDFSKIDGMLDALGNNVRTDMEPWEMRRFYDLYTKINNPEIYQRVLENSEEGLLYHPPETKETGYILLPIGNNYEKIRQMFQDIFSLPPQTDINPK